jgi:guanylate cyclase
MVASGLPKRNGDRHAAEIASLALDMMETISYIVMSHRPDQHLQMQIGINTGR